MLLEFVRLVLARTVFGSKLPVVPFVVLPAVASSEALIASLPPLTRATGIRTPPSPMLLYPFETVCRERARDFPCRPRSDAL
jgi:hypothetical protein